MTLPLISRYNNGIPRSVFAAPTHDLARSTRMLCRGLALTRLVIDAFVTHSRKDLSGVNWKTP